MEQRDKKGRFVRGYTPTEKTRRKISEKLKGKHNSRETEFKKGDKPFNQKEYMKEYREKNKEKIKIQQKGYYQKQEIMEKRKEYHQNYCEENKNNPQFKLKRKINQKKYVKINPEIIKAHNMANRKLKHLKKPGFVFHHPDYSKPLLVEVLPIKIHRQIHVQLNFGGMNCD